MRKRTSRKWIRRERRIPAQAKRTMREVIVGLEELEVGRARLRAASAAMSAPKVIVALAAIQIQAKRVVRVLDPFFR